MKYKKHFISLSVASAAVLAVASAASGAVIFKDVDEKSPYFADITLLSELTIIKGYADGTFKPQANVTRAEFATMVWRLFDMGEPTTTNHFSDVDSKKYYAKAVNKLAENKLIHGYGNSTFKPNQPVTREEAAKILAIALGLPLNGESNFNDVPANSPFSKYIHALNEKEIISGTSETLYSPKLNITREQVAATLARVYHSQNTEFELSLLHVNDTHGRVEEMTRLATAVQDVRKENPDALLLHAGDVFSGTLYFNEFLGQADLEMMNYIGFDVMALGNHEFDLGSSPEGHKALADFIKGANFPVISANVDVSQDALLADLSHDTYEKNFVNGELYKGIIKEVNGEKIGIFGLTTEDTAAIASPEKVEFTDYIDAANEAVETFQQQGINKIIALTHLGYDDSPEVDNDIELAKYVDGIDIIVGGHSHTLLEKPVVVSEDENGQTKHDTIIVQAYQYSEYLGTLDVEFNDEGLITSIDGNVIKLADFEPDAGALEIVNKYKPRIEEIMNQEIGLTLDEPLLNPRASDIGNESGVSVRNSETILGNLITDGMLHKARQYSKEKVVMALQNGGGIRASIDAGPVTTGEIITVLPYGNTLALMQLTGAEIVAAFEHSLKDYPKESGGFLHVSGANVKFDSSKPAGNRVVSVEIINEDGSKTELEETITYTIATNAFTAKGGDGFTMLAQAYIAGRVIDLGLSDWENFAEHLTSEDLQIPTNTEGRIVDVAK